MTPEQKQRLFEMIEEALRKANHFEEDGGKITIIIPKKINKFELTRQVRVSLLREDIDRI